MPKISEYAAAGSFNDADYLVAVQGGVTVKIARGVFLGASLVALDDVTPAADRLPYFNGASTSALATFTAAARTLLDDATVADMRVTLGGTTVGSNVFTLTNPSAVSYFKIAADNTVSAISAATLGADLSAHVKPTESLVIACSDETTAITTGTAKVTFRMPYAFTLTAVRASVTTAPTGSTIIIDINEAGSTILSTKLSIDASEKTSTTAASAAVISDASLADDAEMTIDFDQVGSTIAGAGVKVTLIGTRT